MTRKITFYVVVILIGVLGLAFIYKQYNRQMFCNTWLQSYMQHPPTNVEDYTSQDVAYNELCSGSSTLYDIAGVLVVVVVGVGIVGRGKKKKV